MPDLIEELHRLNHAIDHLNETLGSLRFQALMSRLDRVERATTEIHELLKVVLRKEIQMAGELDALQTQVAANTDAEASAVVVLNKLHELLVAAGTDPTKLNDLKNQLAASKDALAAAITANTPAA